MRKLLYVICLPALLMAVSCKKTYQDYGVTSTVKMSNGWWVTYYKNGVVQSNPTFFSTYNTSSNTDSLWIDDLKKVRGFKCKFPVNQTNLTFAGTNAANAYYDGTANFIATVTVTGGKVLLKAGHSRAGNITDSIYFQAVFSTTPADTWTVTGTARTGFVEDDY